MLINNKNYIILFMSMSFSFGMMSLIFVFLPWMTKTYNFDSECNGYIIVSANLGGCLGCIIIGILGK